METAEKSIATVVLILEPTIILIRGITQLCYAIGAEQQRLKMPSFGV